MLIYIAALETNKYYIGKTLELQKIIDNFEKGETDLQWIKTFNFIHIIETFAGDDFDLDKTVYKYMSKYGIENVRGGMFSEPILSFEQHLTINKHINSSNNTCLACGSVNHTIEKCDTIICYRCGRLNHDANSCSETTHFLNGSTNGCYRCGRSDHWRFRCNRSRDIYGRVLKSKFPF